MTAPTSSEALLAVEDLQVQFGGVRALDGVSLRVPTGGVVGLIGPNGAGKTTLINAATGVVSARRGSVAFGGEPILGHTTAAIARRGIARTFQRPELFPDLSVREHLVLALRARRQLPPLWRDLLGLGRTRRPSGDEVALVEGVLERLGITELADGLPDELPHGSRRLVEVARATVSEPRLLLLDEPSAGLDSAETVQFGEALLELCGPHGTTALLIEHDLDLVTMVCDYVFVLDFGRIIGEGTAAEVISSPIVRAAYLGHGWDGGDTTPAAPPTEVVGQ